MRTTDTEALIRELAGGPVLVQPLARPAIRVATWLAIALPSALLVMVVMPGNREWVTRLLLPRVIGEEAFALSTGILAAVAAFASVVPGYNRKVLFLPLVPLAFWLGGLGQSSVRDWLQLTAQGFSMRSEWVCLPATIMAGAVPAVAMAVMLRRGAPLTPRLSTVLGGLAAAGLGNLGVCVTHHAYGNVLVLVWHAGIVVGLTMILGSAGRRVLNWQSLIEQTRCTVTRVTQSGAPHAPGLTLRKR
jgi:hypothetical protein